MTLVTRGHMPLRNRVRVLLPKLSDVST